MRGMRNGQFGNGSIFSVKNSIAVLVENLEYRLLSIYNDCPKSPISPSFSFQQFKGIELSGIKMVSISDCKTDFCGG